MRCLAVNYWGEGLLRTYMTCWRMAMGLLVEIWKRSSMILPSLLASREDFTTISPTSLWNKSDFSTSVAYPGCLSRSPDQNFSIPDPGSRVKKIPDPESGAESKNLSILTQKIVPLLSEI
jgi:hypothetical protein